jgi:hypothetical protein
MDGKGKSNLKAKERGRESECTTPEEWEDHGSRGGINDGDGRVHEQDTKEESGAKGVEAASWLSNRIEKAKEARMGAVVQ